MTGLFIVAEYDREIISLAQQILGQPKPKSDPMPAEPRALPSAHSEAQLKAQRPAPEVKVDARPESPDLPQSRETKTAAELAQMIEADLAKHPQCPRRGFAVTVYGTTLWRAMLTITPAAGPIRNPQEWRDLTEELAERLRKRYDLDWR
jgi:hypothetical protein